MPEPLSPALKTLGNRIRKRRTEMDISQEGLAERSGLHWTFIGQVERGQRNLSVHNLLKVAKGLTLDPGDLVTGLKPPTS